MSHPALAAVALALLLAGCPPGDDGAPPEASPVVTFVRSGGFAGVNDRLQLRADGTALITASRASGPVTARPTSAELEAVRVALDASGMADLDRSYVGRLADGFRYEVTYGGRTVAADEDVVPGSLRAAVELLIDLFERYRQ